MQQHIIYRTGTAARRTISRTLDLEGLSSRIVQDLPYLFLTRSQPISVADIVNLAILINRSTLTDWQHMSEYAAHGWARQMSVNMAHRQTDRHMCLNQCLARRDPSQAVIQHVTHMLCYVHESLKVLYSSCTKAVLTCHMSHGFLGFQLCRYFLFFSFLLVNGWSFPL
jgi:hypothetical protein